MPHSTGVLLAPDSSSTSNGVLVSNHPNTLDGPQPTWETVNLGGASTDTLSSMPLSTSLMDIDTADTERG
jgi:hypothetical protein